MTNQEMQQLCQRLAQGELTVTDSSRFAGPDTVFVAMPAPQPHGTVLPQGLSGGEEYAVQAAAAGAVAVVCRAEVAPLLRDALEAFPVCQVMPVENVREALGQMARLGFPKHNGLPKVIGITGTNGKTTVSYLLEYLLTQAGKSAGVLGTVAYRWPGHYEEAPLTTPGCLALHSLLARMGASGVEYAVMEVSSHALDQSRVAGIDFSAGLFTNLTQDHLDYHPDMEHYFAAKARLLRTPEAGGTPLAGKALACNVDDAHGLRLFMELPTAIGFGLTRPAGEHAGRILHGTVLEHNPSGLRLAMQFGNQRWEFHTPLVGAFNASNLLAAQAVLLGLGFDAALFQTLAHFPGVPGRLQRVPSARGISAFVDYAHTPDALVNVLSTLREVGFQRIITVFGCGGNRDATKRPLMGKAVAEFSDIAVLTSDNPRKENPEAIMAAVLPGLTEAGSPVHVVQESDRRKALALAVSMARPGDALLVAGKGHETYQIIGDVKHPFCDVTILRELLA